MFRKILILLLLVGLGVSPSYAGKLDTKEIQLKISDADLIDYALTSGVAVTTDSVYVPDNAGGTALLVDNAGDVDISIEYSIDDTNFYTAYVASGGTVNLDGTLDVDGDVVTALGTVSRYIILPDRPSKYVRFVLDPDASGTISASYIYLRDR